MVGTGMEAMVMQAVSRLPKMYVERVVKTNFQMDERLHRVLKLYAKERRMFMYEAVDHLLRKGLRRVVSEEGAERLEERVG